MNIKAQFQDGNGGIVMITTNHPSSSYGIPVVIPTDDWTRPYMPDVYGPNDLLRNSPLILMDDVDQETINQLKGYGFKIA